MRPFFLVLLSSLLVAFYSPDLFAAPTPPPTAAPTPTPVPIVLNHCRFISNPRSINDLFFSQMDPKEPGFKDTSIVITGIFRSGFYTYDKAKPLFFYRHVNGTPTLAASVDLSSTADLSLLLFQPKTGTDQFDITVYPDDPTSLPGGSFRFVNLSPKTLSVKLGDATFDVEPQKFYTYIPATAEDRVFNMTLSEKESGKAFYSNLWGERRTTVRWLIFMFQPDAHGYSMCKISDSSTAATAPVTPQPMPTLSPTPTPTHTPKPKPTKHAS